MSQTFNKVTITDENIESDLDIRVLKIESDTETGIRAYSPGSIAKPGEKDYSEIKRKYGPLAATDPERKARTTKDSRFTLSSMLRDTLAIDEEEKGALAERVQIEVESIADKARDEAARQGYDDGIKKAYAEAFDSFKAEGDKRLAQFESFLASCNNAKTEIFKENEEFILHVIYNVARNVLLRELEADKGYLLRPSP